MLYHALAPACDNNLRRNPNHGQIAAGAHDFRRVLLKLPVDLFRGGLRYINLCKPFFSLYCGYESQPWSTTEGKPESPGQNNCRPKISHFSVGFEPDSNASQRFLQTQSIAFLLLNLEPVHSRDQRKTFKFHEHISRGISVSSLYFGTDSQSNIRGTSANELDACAVYELQLWATKEDKPEFPVWNKCLMKIIFPWTGLN